MNRLLLSGVAKPLVFALALLPSAWLLYAVLADHLGANPTEALVRATGDWTLRFVCIVLAVTPLRVTLGLTGLARLRRMLGLYAFFYAVLHLSSYVWFDMGLELDEVARDVAKRPFILVGFCAFVLFTLLAATSFNRAVRWLGAARWQRLHRSVYAIAVLAVLHFFWMRAAKNNLAEVALYAAILGILLAWRLNRAVARRASDRPSSRAGGSGAPDPR